MSQRQDIYEEFIMRCHEVDYQILGDDMQIVEIELDPGETVIAEAGAMNYMDEGIRFEAHMGDGSRPDDGLMGKPLMLGHSVDAMSSPYAK